MTRMGKEHINEDKRDCLTRNYFIISLLVVRFIFLSSSEEAQNVVIKTLVRMIIEMIIIITPPKITSSEEG